MTTNEINIEELDIQLLIPQRPPFIMIDRLVHFDPVVTKTETLVRPDNLFAEGEYLNSCALVENIAQTCAARMGYVNYISREKVKLGFIGSIKNLKVLRKARVGERLLTTITAIKDIMQVSLVEATIAVGDEIIVTAEMKIALSDIDAQ